MRVFSSEEPTLEKLDNGFLKIKARIYKEDVYLFTGGELNIPDDYVNVLYPYREFAKQEIIDRLSEIPVIEGHTEINTDNSELIVGHPVGKPELVDGSIFVNFLITNKKTIEKIQNKQLHDVSVFFNATKIRKDGEFNGKKYDYSVADVELLHIGLLPAGEGRMGQEVSIANSKGKTMDDNVKIQIEELKKLHENLTSELKILKEENEKLKEEKKELEKKCSDEVMSQKIAEAEEDKAVASTIQEATQVKVQNKGLSGQDLYKATLNSLGVNTDGMSFEALKASFDTAGKIASKMAAVKKEDCSFFANKKSITNNFDKKMSYDDQFDMEARTIVK